ncbi:fadB [Symbiodinium sp. CCMP2592]|nr:fadB [Symbiodinium sp. CCMP2592]
MSVHHQGFVIAAVVQRSFRNDVIVIDDEAESNIAAAVLCVNVATHTGAEQLFDFLRRREVCGAVDVRLRPTRAAAALRRFAVSQGLDWEWRPALAATGSTGAEAAERAAVLVRLAKAAWTKNPNGGRNKLPCVLFEGEDWHNCTARRRLADELRQRGVALRHAGNTPEEDEQPLEVPKELVEAAAKAAKDAEAAAVPPIREPEPPPLSDPPSASQAARPATCRGRASRKRGASGPATVFEALEEAAELFVGLRHARAERLMVDRKLCNTATAFRLFYISTHTLATAAFTACRLTLGACMGLAAQEMAAEEQCVRSFLSGDLLFGSSFWRSLQQAGLSMLVYQRLRRAIRMSRLVDEQLERWTKKGPAKEPVVECEVPVEHGATGQDVDLDVVEVPVGLAFECERIRQQLRQKFGCESDAEVVEALLGHFKEREGMVPEEEEALLQLPWIDVAALAQLTYWYDRRPRETEEVQDVPKEAS